MNYHRRTELFEEILPPMRSVLTNILCMQQSIFNCGLWTQCHFLMQPYLLDLLKLANLVKIVH